ncbi:MAG: trans-4-hydroxy-L-proline dehydratase activase [Romboutsia sp.]|uniref:trans-4-hydroxy-L-proline dehydratase activase n=1 Tax=Romboutsia sp. TaxID=1965302 RepID=UPI003F2E8065
MKNPLVINIQKCSIHDGPGIRTTIFFKGCPLKCAWCHNPESQSYTKEVMYNKEQCRNCEICMSKCPNNAIYKENDNIYLSKEKCIFCETCLDYCLNNAREIVGKEYSIKEIMKEIEKDMIFYEQSNGGVTLSGGEVMALNIDFIKELLKSCSDKGIHTSIDTCGYTSFDNFDKVLPYTKLFLYDIKLIDCKKHKLFTDVDNTLILNNVKKLSEKGANINIRIPLIEGVNVDDENIEIKKIISFLLPLNIKYVNLLPYHDIGMYKYQKLYKEYKGFEFKCPSDYKLEEIKNLFEENDFTIKVGG